MLDINNKENVLVISLTILEIILLIVCIVTKEILDIAYFVVFSYYFVRILLIRIKD